MERTRVAVMGGIGVVVNPHAGRKRRRQDCAERLARIVGDAGIVRETETPDGVVGVAEEFRDRGIDILAIFGGDGSVFRSLSAFVPAYAGRSLPPILALRAGTINFVAASVGCRRGDPEKVLAHVVRDYRQGGTHDITERDLLCVNGTQYGFAFGCGAVVSFLRAYYGTHGGGRLAAISLLAKVVVSSMTDASFARSIVQPVEADIFCDDERVPFRVFTVVLGATVTQVALGFKPTYLGSRKRGYLHLVAGPVGAREFMRNIVRFYRGFPTGEDRLYDNLAREVVVRFARPEAYMLDGDVLPPVATLEVRTGPRVTMIRG